MKVSDIIRNTINRLPNDYIFTYLDFSVEVKQYETARKYLSKMASEGKIIKVSQGRYYKPTQTPLGNLPVSIYQILKDLLEDGTKRVGYITGYSAFNELMLTTQIPSSYQIATNSTKKPIVRGNYKIKFILQKNTITKENIKLLKILDCIKLIKKIPDTTIDKSVIRFKTIIKELNNNEINDIIKLAMKYAPFTRALLGAIIEITHSTETAKPLFNSLNGISRYNLDISINSLPNKQNWKIQ